MSRVVFVGNVPYDMTEEQLIDVFSSVGPVVGFRLVFDRDTGKPKGYGFCEFKDHETAQSAVRNLHGTDVGGRPLRIDLADSDPFLEGKTTNRGEILDRDDHRPVLPQLPPGVPVPPNSSALDVISKVLASMPPGQLMEVLGHAKGLVQNNPDQARLLLNTHPQLAYAFFQAMVMNNIVDPSVLQRMLAASQQNNPPPKPAPPPIPVQVAPPPPPQAMYPPYYAVPPQPTMHLPPPAPVAAPAPPVAAALPDQQKTMLMQVLSLTPEQINALPPDQKAAIMQLRGQLMGMT